MKLLPLNDNSSNCRLMLRQKYLSIKACIIIASEDMGYNSCLYNMLHIASRWGLDGGQKYSGL